MLSLAHCFAWLLCRWLMINLIAMVAKQDCLDHP